VKKLRSIHMGVSKGEGGGRWSPPNGWRSLVLGEGGPCWIWRSGGFPKFSRKIFPLKPFFPLPQPFFLLFDPFLQFFHPLNASPQLSRAGLHQPFLPSQLSFSSSDLLKPYRTSSEYLRNPSIGSPKRPKNSLFRGTPKTPKKGLKTPFLTPFSPLPYPL